MLRELRGKELADKHFKRILKTFKESQLNKILKLHSIKIPSISTSEKIKLIINEGISLRGILLNDLYPDNYNKTQRKKSLQNFIENNLFIETHIKGSSLEQKIDSILMYFKQLELDSKIGISADGYNKLLSELSIFYSNNELELEKILKEEFEIYEDNILNSDFLLDFNIKPRDVIDLLSKEQLKQFVKSFGMKQRGNLIENVIDNYKDTENMFLENYINIADRNINLLKENGINVSEVDLGLKFEELTKNIFKSLGFNVDEKLRNEINNKSDKMDILIRLEDNQIIIIECKTNKDKSFSKFSSVSRQINSYVNLVEKHGYIVIKTLLIAPDFSDDFKKECGLDYRLNISLIKAEILLNILNSFKDNKLKVFPHNLFMRDVEINDDIVIRALKK